MLLDYTTALQLSGTSVRNEVQQKEKKIVFQLRKLKPSPLWASVG